MTFSQSRCWIKHFTLSHKWNITKTYGTPVVPKILSSKSKTSRLSNAVSIVLIAFLDQNVQNLKDSWFYSISKHIPKCEFFLEKSAKNFKLHNIVKTHSGIQKICPTRRWKAKTSYFSVELFSGTIMIPMVPKNTHMLSIQNWIGLKEVILNYLGLGNKCWLKVSLWKCPPLRVLFESIWPQNNICRS